MSPHARLGTPLLLSGADRTHEQKIGKPETRSTSPTEVTLPDTHAVAVGPARGTCAGNAYPDRPY